MERKRCGKEHKRLAQLSSAGTSSLVITASLLVLQKLLSLFLLEGNSLVLRI